MREVILHEFVSIDCLAAGPRDDLDWFTSTAGEIDTDILGRLEQVDTILLGRRTYQGFAEYWPTPAAKDEPTAEQINTIPKIVFTGTLDAAPWGTWGTAAVERRPAEQAVADLKRREGGAMILWGSISLARTLMRAGLVDEVWLCVAPVVLGEGRALFGNGVDRSDLTLTEAKAYSDSGVVSLRYRSAFRQV
jgi:dihydrofolate reductase